MKEKNSLNVEQNKKKSMRMANGVYQLFRKQSKRACKKFIF